jgi:iron complex outermembrane receptor protein
MPKMSRDLLLGSAALLAIIAPGVAAAAESAAVGVEEVIVVAEKRPENIQNVPMSVSAFSGDQLAKANINTVADASRFVPSLSIQQSNNNRNSSVIMRNVGTSGTNAGTDQDVGIFIDGVYIQVAGPVYSELNDISTVEVLRGPQGTLYGRNTPVGAINVTTRAPRQEKDASVTVQGGNFGRFKVAGVVGGGITDNVAGRLSFWFDKEDGFYKNIYDGSRTGADTKSGLRGRLRWTPDADTTLDLIAYYSHARNNGNNATQVDPLGTGEIVFGYNPVPTSFATSPFVIAQKATNPAHPYVVPGKWQVDIAQGSEDVTNLTGVSLQGNRKVSGVNAVVTDILAYNSYFDHAPNVGPGQLPLDVLVNEQRDKIEAISNEFRIASDNRQFVEYVAGVYYYHSKLHYDAIATIDAMANRVFPAATGGGGKIPAGNRQTLTYYQTTEAWAVFGQATFNFTDKFRASAGGRWSDDKKSGSITAALSNITGGPISPVFSANQGGGGALSASRDDSGGTWSAGLQYDVNPDVMTYATAGSGYKDGGFNSRSAVITPYTFDPETSLTYEVGVKSTFFDHRLLLNVDIFRMLVKNYQQSVLLPAGTGFAIGNAGNFRNQGVEADAQANPIQPLSLKASLSYIDSKITGGADHLTCDQSYPFAGSAPPASSGQYTDATKKFCNFNGLTLPYAPKWRSSLSARWEQPLADTHLRWFVSGSMSYQSSQYMDPSLDPRSYQSGYALYDALIGITPDGGRWRATIWGKNLSDHRYFITEAPQTQGANISAGGTAAANGYIGWLGTPRTYGVELSYTW